MKVQNKTISRSYTISQKELKKKLRLKGDIQSIGLWSGLNSHQDIVKLYLRDYLNKH